MIFHFYLKYASRRRRKYVLLSPRRRNRGVFTFAELLQRDSRSAVRFEMDNLRDAVLRDAAAYGVSYWEEPSELEDWEIEEMQRRES